MNAEEANRDIERDPVHPGGEMATSVELPEGPPQLNHDFLREVFPRVTVGAVNVTDLVQNLFVLLDAVLESFP
jgi:hypothetical protein